MSIKLYISILSLFYLTRIVVVLFSVLYVCVVFFFTTLYWQLYYRLPYLVKSVHGARSLMM